MLFLIRETLIIHWGKNISVMNGEKAKVMSEPTVCKDFVNCDYCVAGKNKKVNK